MTFSTHISVLHMLGVPVYIRTHILDDWNERKSQQGNVALKVTKQQVINQATQVAKTSEQLQLVQKDTSDIPQLSIGILSCREVLVLFDCEHQAAIERSLIERMITRCGCQIDVLPFAHFRWPMVHEKQLSQSVQQASAALNALAKSKLAEPLWLLVCGNDARAYYASDQWQVDHARVIYLPYSAQEMIQRPELRKSVWNALQPLRDAFHKQISKNT